MTPLNCETCVWWNPDVVPQEFADMSKPIVALCMRLKRWSRSNVIGSQYGLMCDAIPESDRLYTPNHFMCKYYEDVTEG